MAYVKVYKYKKQYSDDQGVTWYDVTPAEYAPSGEPIGYYDTYEECIAQYRTIQSGYTCVGVDKHNQDVYEVSYDEGATWEVVSTSAGTLIETNSYDCGYRTRNVSAGYTCVGVDKYELIENQVSYDYGSTWTTTATTTGSLIETNSYDCGYRTRRTTSGIAYCTGYDKYIDIYSQVSTDYGSTWTTTATTPTLIEVDSPGCGYVPPTPTFEGKIKLTYGSGQIYSAECDSTSAVTYVDIDTSIYTRSAMTSAIVGNCVTQILHDPERRRSPFRQCSGLTSVLLPSSLRFIDDYSFAWCVSLTGITIPSGVTSIGTNEILQDGGGSERGAFYDCRALAYVYIPNTVATIGKNAFMKCSGLTFIDIPDSITTIGSRAFEDCIGLISINLPNGVTSIDNYVFRNCSGLTSIDIPSSVTSIGEYAFADCSSLPTIDIPSGVTSIGGYAFRYCTSLTSVTIPNSVTSIGGDAFRYCSGLTSCTLGSGVTSIGNQAFEYCSGLTSITIPSGVTSIGNWTFGYCSGLTGITINAKTPPTLGTYAFNSTNSCPIYVPAASVNAYKSATNWRSYSSRIQAIP